MASRGGASSMLRPTDAVLSGPEVPGLRLATLIVLRGLQGRTQPCLEDL